MHWTSDVKRGPDVLYIYITWIDTVWRDTEDIDINSTQLISSLLTNGSRMAKRNTVHKNKSNDESEWDKKTIKQTIKTVQ